MAVVAAGMSSNRALHPHLSLSRIVAGVAPHRPAMITWRFDSAGQICSFFGCCSFARPVLPWWSSLSHSPPSCPLPLDYELDKNPFTIITFRLYIENIAKPDQAFCPWHRSSSPRAPRRQSPTIPSLRRGRCWRVERWKLTALFPLRHPLIARSPRRECRNLYLWVLNWTHFPYIIPNGLSEPCLWRRTRRSVSGSISTSIMAETGLYKIYFNRTAKQQTESLLALIFELPCAA